MGGCGGLGRNDFEQSLLWEGMMVLKELNPPRFWHRYVDDTFVIHNEVNKQDFLQHINSVDPAIKFTVEDNKEDGSIPFLDTIVKPEEMVVYPLLCTGNLPIETSTYSGIATITSLPSSV